MKKLLPICTLVAIVATSCTNTVNLDQEQVVEMRVRTTIDYSITPEQLLGSDGCESKLTAPVFQTVKSPLRGKVSCEAIIVSCLSCSEGSGVDLFSSEQMLDWMKQQHYRPGTAQELLTLMNTGGWPLMGLRDGVALGSTATDWYLKGPRYLEVNSSKMVSVGYTKDAQKWNGGEWFLAFEQPPDTFKFYHEELHP